MFKSYRRDVEDEIDDFLTRKNAAAGLILQNAIKSEIVEEGLVDSGRYLNSVTSDSDATGAVAGTNVKRDGFSYPTALEFGTRYMRAYAPMRKAAVKTAPKLQAVYRD